MSIFVQRIRTNNGFEGLHERLNSGAKNHQFLNLYKFTQVLHTEATYISTQVQFMSNGVALRY